MRPDVHFLKGTTATTRNCIFDFCILCSLKTILLYSTGPLIDFVMIRGRYVLEADRYRVDSLRRLSSGLGHNMLTRTTHWLSVMVTFVTPKMPRRLYSGVSQPRGGSGAGQNLHTQRSRISGVSTLGSVTICILPHYSKELCLYKVIALNVL